MEILINTTFSLHVRRQTIVSLQLHSVSKDFPHNPTKNQCHEKDDRNSFILNSHCMLRTDNMSCSKCTQSLAFVLHNLTKVPWGAGFGKSRMAYSRRVGCSLHPARVKIQEIQMTRELRQTVDSGTRTTVWAMTNCRCMKVTHQSICLYLKIVLASCQWHK